MAKLFQQILLALLIVFIVTVSAKPQIPQPKPCPPNQEWKSCGTACPLKCGQPAPKFCTYQCIIGCQCKDGYLQKSNGECVLNREC